MSRGSRRTVLCLNDACALIAGSTIRDAASPDQWHSLSVPHHRHSGGRPRRYRSLLGKCVWAPGGCSLLATPGASRGAACVPRGSGYSRAATAWNRDGTWAAGMPMAVVRTGSGAALVHSWRSLVLTSRPVLALPIS